MSKTFKMSILLIIITLGILFLSQTSVNAVVIDSAETLKEAFKDKSANIVGTTITLTGDVEFKNPNWTEGSYEVEFDVVELGGDDYVLELNGHTLTMYELQLKDGSITINKNSYSGTISTDFDGVGVWVYPEAEMVVNNGTIDSAIINQGTLNIKNGDFRQFIQNYFDYDYENNVLNSVGILNIENGTFSGIGQEGIATINGGIYRNSAGFTPLTITLYEENAGAASTTIKGGEFITSNTVDCSAIAIANNSVTLKEDEIDKYIAEGYVAIYDKASIVTEGASPYVSYTPRVKVSSQKILDFLDKIAPNGVWTVNSYRPTDPLEGMTVLTATLKETLEKEEIDYSELEVYGSFDGINPEEGSIQLGDYGKEEIRKVKVVYNEPDEEADNETKDIINEFLAKNDKLNLKLDDVNEKTAYRVEDLYLINYFYNAKRGIDNSLALNFSKELIEDANGSNIYFRFYGGFGEGDSTELYSFEGGQGAVFHKGTIYASINSGVTLNHVLYIPSDTDNTTDAYISAALKRIKDYLGTTDGIEIEVGDTFESLNENEDVTHWNQNGFIDETTCGSYYYNITINEKTYRFAICKKDAKDLENPKYLASDIMSNICIESDSTEIPLDTAISAEEITSNEKIEKALGTNVYIAFNISLYSNAKQENITKLDNGEFLVSIPVPEILKNVNDEKITVYYINDAGEKDDCVAIVKDGMATFKTKHFSIYAVAEKIDTNEGAEGEKEEQTYKVIFKSNGGKFRNGNETLTYEEWKYTDYDNLEKPTREGYKFLGYYTEEGILFDLYYTEAGVDRDMVLEAKWEELKDNNTGNTTDDASNPQTGDVIVLYVGILVIAVIGIVATMKLKNTKK